MNANLCFGHVKSIARGLASHRTPRLSRHFSTRSVSKESSTAFKHREIAEVLGKSSSSSSSPERSPEEVTAAIKDANRKARYHQAIINGLVSFTTVILAAQLFKSSKEKEKVEAELDLVVKQLEEKRSLLKALHSEEIVGHLADRCVDSLRESVHSPDTTLSWLETLLGRRIDDEKNGFDDAMTRNTIADTLEHEMTRIIGIAGLSDAELAKTELSSLQNNADSILAFIEAIDEKNETQEMEKIQVLEDETGATVIKKRVFSI